MKLKTNKGKGWHNESMRHSLSAKGISNKLDRIEHKIDILNKRDVGVHKVLEGKSPNKHSSSSNSQSKINSYKEKTNLQRAKNEYDNEKYKERMNDFAEEWLPY